MDFTAFKKKYQKKQVRCFPNSVTPNPLVSVCLQTYQHEVFIEECIESVLAQETNFEYEIIIGEDASKDRTREICKEYAQKYPDKIRLLLHEADNKISIDGRVTGRFNFLYKIK